MMKTQKQQKIIYNNSFFSKLCNFSVMFVIRYKAAGHSHFSVYGLLEIIEVHRFLSTKRDKTEKKTKEMP